jgi:hypothetical protein
LASSFPDSFRKIEHAPSADDEFQVFLIAGRAFETGDTTIPMERATAELMWAQDE